MLLKSKSGCKVGWEWYPTKAEAQARASEAREEAQKREAQGYDFGYCVPGLVDECDDGTFRVTVP